MSNSNCPVLVVEDDSSIREMLIDSLEDAGLTVVGTANGREAWQQLEQGLRPCLIVLDLMMPHMDGWQFRARQQADPALADIPVLIITASRDAAEGPEILRVQHWVSKPFKLHQVIELAQRYYVLSNPQP
jgi:CheY-like chemotaxis protein